MITRFCGDGFTHSPLRYCGVKFWYLFSWLVYRSFWRTRGLFLVTSLVVRDVDQNAKWQSSTSRLRVSFSCYTPFLGFDVIGSPKIKRLSSISPRVLLDGEGDLSPFKCTILTSNSKVNLVMAFKVWFVCVHTNCRVFLFWPAKVRPCSAKGNNSNK